MYQMYNFERARVEVEELNTVSKQELHDFYMVRNSISTCSYHNLNYTQPEAEAIGVQS